MSKQCPKCALDFARRDPLYKYGQGRHCVSSECNVLTQKNVSCYLVREWLNVTCARCSYTWEEPCKDAPEKFKWVVEKVEWPQEDPDMGCC